MLTPEERASLHKAIDTWADGLGKTAGAVGELVFDETFDTLDFSRWASVPIVNDAAGNGSSLPGNSERQWYINHRYSPTQGVKPWRVENGELVITASRTPETIRQIIGYDPKLFPGMPAEFLLGRYNYVSGRLSTHNSFSQLYGYFEAEIKCPKGQGLWPAFWLLPADMAWPPEIDVLEVLGHDPLTAYQTVHWNDPPVPEDKGGVHKSDHVAPKIDTTQWHRYGVRWAPDFVVFFIDGVETGRFPTPLHLKTKPMYMILNLAVGGSWPRDPDASTVFPAEMRVRSVKAWKL